jgi:hypothetical protein
MVPVAPSIEATDVFVLLHKPLPVELVSEPVDPAHKVVGPEIAAGVPGTVLTVTADEVGVDPQVLDTVYIMFTVPPVIP